MLKIAKPFPYSTDGIRMSLAAVGDDPSSVPEKLHAGLIAEGFLIEVREPTPLENKTVAPVVSPHPADVQQKVAPLATPPIPATPVAPKVELPIKEIKVPEVPKAE